MIKNKEDDFLGDAITNNIKYYDNEWQAQGTVDRGSMFTKEPLLHLLFEGKEYDNTVNDYSEYVPRTTQTAAKLTHDLLVLDNYYYIASATASSINIFDIETFAKKSFAIANPIYDKNARVQLIPLIDYNKIGKRTLFEFFTDIVSIFPITEELDSVSKIEYVLQYRYGIPKNEIKIATVESLKDNELFNKDFSLTLHDQDSIKLPYVPRVKTTKTESGSNVNGTIYTRFLINALSGSLKSNNEWTSQLQKYQEFMYDALEESILKTFFADKADFYLNGKKDDFNTSDYVYELNDDYKAGILKQLGNIYNGITRCNSELFVGEATDLTLKRGVVLLNEELASNIFQDDTSNYRLFNKFCVCYPTANDIIGLRTPIGGWKVLLATAWEKKSALTESVVSNDFSNLFSRYKEDLFPVGEDGFAYPTLLYLQNIYEIGNGLEKSTATDFTLCEPIKQWLNNECLIVKAPVYGDYVEELNFMQDLNPDSNVVFKNLRLKQTSIPFERYQDSKYEVPFVEKTAPLINKAANGKQGFGVYASDAIAGVGEYPGNNPDIRNGEPLNPALVQLSDRFTSPAFLYDFDKGSQENSFDEGIDNRSKTLDASAQRVNPKAGVLNIEGAIKSPTIDELWTFLKYLTESDGRNPTGEELDSRIPSFYGLLKDDINNLIVGKTGHEAVGSTKNRINPRANGAYKTTPVIDILDWEVVTDDSLPQYFDPGKDSDVNKCHEFRFGGYNITEHIDKIYDYKIEAFDRRSFVIDGQTKIITDGQVYEFDTEKEFVKNEDPYNHPKGYLEKLYNDAIVNFLNGFNDDDTYDLLQIDIFEQDSVQDVTTPIFTTEKDEQITSGKLYAPLKKVSLKKTGTDSTSDSDTDSFDDSSDSSNDSNSNNSYDTEDGGVQEMSRHRWNAYKLLSRILDYGTYKSKDIEAGHPLHNHYKNYLTHPKNLKEIERDLETLRQNLQTAIEYLITTQVEKGFADRNINRGTLHSLHRNSYEFTSTLIPLMDVNNTQANGDVVYVKPLTDSLNDVNEFAQDDTTLSVSSLDTKVVYDDGRYYEESENLRFKSRYFHDNYDTSVIDLSGPRLNTRNVHEMYRPNETLLSEVYLAADGTWRSVHEHPVIAVLDCEE